MILTELFSKAVNSTAIFQGFSGGWIVILTAGELFPKFSETDFNISSLNKREVPKSGRSANTLSLIVVYSDETAVRICFRHCSHSSVKLPCIDG